jgi:hypothetical protein
VITSRRITRIVSHSSGEKPALWAAASEGTIISDSGALVGDLTLSNDVRVAFERHKDGDRRTAMLPATFAVAPRYRFRLSGGHEAYGAAQATAFKLTAHGAKLSASKFALHVK